MSNGVSIQRLFNAFSPSFQGWYATCKAIKNRHHRSSPIKSRCQKDLIKYELKMPKVRMVNFNYYIKEVVRLAGLNEPVRISHRRGNIIREEIRPRYAWISWHTARRSFCTNEYLAGTPSDLIMSISGHKSEKSFRK